LYCSLHHCCM